MSLASFLKKLFGQKEEVGQAEVVEESSNLAGTNAVEEETETESQPTETTETVIPNVPQTTEPEEQPTAAADENQTEPIVEPVSEESASQTDTNDQNNQLTA